MRKPPIKAQDFTNVEVSVSMTFTGRLGALDEFMGLINGTPGGIKRIKTIVNSIDGTDREEFLKITGEELTRNTIHLLYEEEIPCSKEIFDGIDREFYKDIQLFIKQYEDTYLKRKEIHPIKKTEITTYNDDYIKYSGNKLEELSKKLDKGFEDLDTRRMK